MQQDALDVARPGAQCSVPLRLRGRPEPRDELRGELVQVVGDPRKAHGRPVGDKVLRRDELDRDGIVHSCVDQFGALARDYDADEIAINLLGDGVDARLAGNACSPGPPVWRGIDHAAAA